MSNTRRKVFISPATNVESFMLLDGTFVKVSGLNHAKAKQQHKKHCIYLKGGEYLCIYFFLCIYLFINPVIAMVTAEVNCVSARQQPRREGGTRRARRASGSAQTTPWRTPVELKMTHSGFKEKNKKSLYLFSMDFCSIMLFEAARWNAETEKEKHTREQTEQEDCRGKDGLPGLQTDLLLLLLRFIHAEGVWKPGTEDKLCVNPFFSAPLYSQLNGNKAQNRSGDLRLCISSGSWPVLLCFFFCFSGGGGIQFPFPT